jgi:hypothetical protein
MMPSNVMHPSRVGIKTLTIQSGGSGDLIAFRAIRAILADRFIRL